MDAFSPDQSPPAASVVVAAAFLAAVLVSAVLVSAVLVFSTVYVTACDAFHFVAAHVASPAAFVVFLDAEDALPAVSSCHVIFWKGRVSLCPL